MRKVNEAAECERFPVTLLGVGGDDQAGLRGLGAFLGGSHGAAVLRREAPSSREQASGRRHKSGQSLYGCLPEQHGTTAEGALGERGPLPCAPGYGVETSLAAAPSRGMRLRPLFLDHETPSADPFPAQAAQGCTFPPGLPPLTGGSEGPGRYAVDSLPPSPSHLTMCAGIAGRGPRS